MPGHGACCPQPANYGPFPVNAGESGELELAEGNRFMILLWFPNLSLLFTNILVYMLFVCKSTEVDNTSS